MPSLMEPPRPQCRDAPPIGRCGAAPPPVDDPLFMGCRLAQAVTPYMLWLIFSRRFLLDGGHSQEKTVERPETLHVIQSTRTRWYCRCRRLCNSCCSAPLVRNVRRPQDRPA